MNLTPQQLIDIPGAGSAEKHLRKDGRWDETRFFDGETPVKVSVTVTGYYEPELETQRFTVTAKSKEQALDIAGEMADFDVVENAVIEKTKEAK